MPDTYPPFGVTACPCGGEGHDMSTRCEPCGARFAEHYNHSCPGAADRSADTFRPLPAVECTMCLCDCAQCTCEDAYCWRCGCGEDPVPECEDCGCDCRECDCDRDDGCGDCGCGVRDPDDDDISYGCTCEHCEAGVEYVRAARMREVTR